MISASDWLAGTSIDGAVLERWPGYQAWLVAADDVDPVRLATAADHLVREAAASARTDDDAHVRRGQDAYRDFGVKPRVARPSVDALLRRAGSDAGLPRINTLVDLYNAISVLHRVPIGGEDLDRYDGPARRSPRTPDASASSSTRSTSPTIEAHERPQSSSPGSSPTHRCAPSAVQETENAEPATAGPRPRAPIPHGPAHGPRTARIPSSRACISDPGS